MKRAVLSCVFLLAIIAAGIILFPTDSKRIKKVLNSGSKAVAEEDADSLMEIISYNYSDDHGGSYLQLKKMAEAVFRRLDDIEVGMDITGVSVEGGRALADLRVSVIASEGSERGYLIGDAAGNLQLKVFLEKSPYKWKVVRIEGLAEGAQQKAE